jgi:hypothetical protein
MSDYIWDIGLQQLTLQRVILDIFVNHMLRLKLPTPVFIDPSYGAARCNILNQVIELAHVVIDQAIPPDRSMIQGDGG